MLTIKKFYLGVHREPDNPNVCITEFFKLNMRSAVTNQRRDNEWLFIVCCRHQIIVKLLNAGLINFTL